MCKARREKQRSESALRIRIDKPYFLRRDQARLDVTSGVRGGPSGDEGLSNLSDAPLGKLSVSV